MAKNIDRLAEKLGAELVGRVPEYSPGAFGVSQLAHHLRSRLEPAGGKRPGRPTEPAWRRHPKVPMSAETERRLRELATLMSDRERKVSPMQVAAQILEDATARYFAQRPGPKQG